MTGIESSYGAERGHILREDIESERKALRALIESLRVEPETELEKQLNDSKFRRTVGKLISHPFIKED